MGMKWVSVKDKLPKDDTSVLITYHFGNPAKRYVEEAQCYKGHWYSSNDEYLIGKYEKVIVAWAELPRPYEGD